MGIKNEAVNLRIVSLSDNGESLLSGACPWKTKTEGMPDTCLSIELRILYLSKKKDPKNS